jgi:hypothetical protein
MPPIPDSILRDILSLLDPLSLAAVVCVSQHYATLGRVLLFRLINVHHSKAGKLFSTIAKNPVFGEWVCRSHVYNIFHLTIVRYTTYIYGGGIPPAAFTVRTLRRRLEPWSISARSTLNATSTSRDLRPRFEAYSQNSRTTRGWTRIWSRFYRASAISIQFIAEISTFGGVPQHFCRA